MLASSGKVNWSILDLERILSSYMDLFWFKDSALHNNYFAKLGRLYSKYIAKIT